MSMDAIPIGVLFAATFAVVLMAIEAGYRLGRAVSRRSEGEKEAPASASTAATLGLLAFMLAFTFGMVASRFDARKGLVRDEANAIRTAWLRTALLPEPDRAEAAGLLRDYVDQRVAAVQSLDLDRINAAMAESVRIQRRLWDQAVELSRKNSQAASLYLPPLNEVINIHAMRVGTGLLARVPGGIWLVLYALILLGMIGVGYQTAIAGSRRSWATSIVALAFSLVISLIAVLDRPQSGFITVSQQPLADLRDAMGAGSAAPSGRGEKP